MGAVAMIRETTVAIPDMQIPLHDHGFVEALQDFAGTHADQLVCVGDEGDLTQTSRWVEGTRAELATSLQADLDATHEVMAGFRAAIGPDVPFICARSNHGHTRLERYLRRAPALDTMRALRYEQALRYDEIDVVYARDPYEFAPGWMLMHGDEGSQSRTPGMTALGLAKKLHRSVLCGHTHKAGLLHHNTSYSGMLTSQLFGLEIGHAMRQDRASYLKAGAADWQQAFGVITTLTPQAKRDGPRIVPTALPRLVMVVDNQFEFEGQVWSW